MHFSVEKDKEFELIRYFTVTILAAEIDKKVQHQLKKAGAKIRIDGFRPGKVPVSVIKQRFGPSIRFDVLKEEIQHQLAEAIKQSGLEVIGVPKNIEFKKNAEGQDVVFVATVEIAPTLTLCDFSTLTLEKPEATISEEDCEKFTQDLLHHQGHWEEKKEDEVAEENDKVTVDYYKMTNDKEVKEADMLHEDILLNKEKEKWPGIFQALLNAKMDEKRTAHLKIEKGPSEEKSDQTSEYCFIIKKIQKWMVQELNQEFFKKIGIQSGKEEFERQIKRRLELDLQKAIKTNMKKQVFDHLLEKHEVSLPSSIVEQETRKVHDDFLKNLQTEAKVLKEDKNVLRMCENAAKSRVKLGLIVDKIIQENAIKIERSDIDEVIDEVVLQYNDPEAARQQMMNDKKMQADFEHLAMENKIIQFVFEKANVTKKEYKGYDFIKTVNQAS